MKVDKSKNPLVSVLTTAYNREKFIGQAIESVLASTYTNFELIIVDDASTDNTVKIARAYESKDSRVKVFVNPKNLGDYGNRNKAASYAKGKYIKYLDSDDLIYPHGLQVMVNCMEKFDDAGFGLSQLNNNNEIFPILLTCEQAYSENYLKSDLFGRAPGSAIIRKSAFEEVGGFSGKRYIGDFELWHILSQKYSMVKMPRDLTFPRIHALGQELNLEEVKYSQLRNDLSIHFINSKDCPLSLTDRKKSIKRLHNQNVKNLLFKILKLRFSSALKYYLALNIGILDILSFLITKLNVSQRFAKYKSFNSGSYWDGRYVNGGDSGAGSYGRLSEFKADFLNNYIESNDVKSVVELGCGDGNQLKLAKYPSYVGVDISKKAISICEHSFVDDDSKSFVVSSEKNILELKKNKFDLAMSLDVIFHLVEDSVYHSYMKNLFELSNSKVIIYSSNKTDKNTPPHVKHRKHTDWVKDNKKEWKLDKVVMNKFPYDVSDPNNTSFADFYVYEKK